VLQSQPILVHGNPLPSSPPKPVIPHLRLRLRLRPFQRLHAPAGAAVAHASVPPGRRRLRPAAGAGIQVGVELLGLHNTAQHSTAWPNAAQHGTAAHVWWWHALRLDSMDC
jgi:hypothetical protein